MIIILMGSNLGRRLEFLSRAEKKVDQTLGEIIVKSSVYETQPWGFKHDHKFLNQILGIKTMFSPEEVLNELLNFETQMGRKRKKDNYTARTIDLDLLFYNNLIINTGKLILPHPRLHLRKFTLIPLKEIVPDLIHPVYNKTISQLLSECSDPLEVQLYKP